MDKRQSKAPQGRSVGEYSDRHGGLYYQGRRLYANEGYLTRETRRHPRSEPGEQKRQMRSGEHFPQNQRVLMNYEWHLWRSEP